MFRSSPKEQGTECLPEQSAYFLLHAFLLLSRGTAAPSIRGEMISAFEVSTGHNLPFKWEHAEHWFGVLLRQDSCSTRAHRDDWQVTVTWDPGEEPGGRERGPKQNALLNPRVILQTENPAFYCLTISLLLCWVEKKKKNPCLVRGGQMSTLGEQGENLFSLLFWKNCLRHLFFLLTSLPCSTGPILSCKHSTIQRKFSLNHTKLPQRCHELYHLM